MPQYQEARFQPIHTQGNKMSRSQGKKINVSKYPIVYHNAQLIAHLTSLGLDHGLTPVNGVVQPPVKPPKNQTLRFTSQLKYLQRTVIKALKIHHYSWVILSPVNSERLNIPDYHSIIKYAMDLETVMRRLENCFYRDAQECILDLQMIFYNCYIYNNETEDVVKMTHALEKRLVSKLSAMPDEEIEIPLHHVLKESQQENVNSGTNSRSYSNQEKRRKRKKQMKQKWKNVDEQIELLREQLKVISEGVQELKYEYRMRLRRPKCPKRTEVISEEEKLQIAADVNKLPKRALPHVFDIIKKKNSAALEDANDNVVVNFELIKPSVLQKIKLFISNFRKEEREKRGKRSIISHKNYRTHRMHVDNIESDVDILGSDNENIVSTTTVDKNEKTKRLKSVSPGKLEDDLYLSGNSSDSEHQNATGHSYTPKIKENNLNLSESSSDSEDSDKPSNSKITRKNQEVQSSSALKYASSEAHSYKITVGEHGAGTSMITKQQSKRLHPGNSSSASIKYSSSNNLSDSSNSETEYHNSSLKKNFKNAWENKQSPDSSLTCAEQYDSHYRKRRVRKIDVEVKYEALQDRLEELNKKLGITSKQKNVNAVRKLKKKKKIRLNEAHNTPWKSSVSQAQMFTKNGSSSSTSSSTSSSIDSSSSSSDTSDSEPDIAAKKLRLDKQQEIDSKSNVSASTSALVSTHVPNLYTNSNVSNEVAV